MKEMIFVIHSLNFGGSEKNCIRLARYFNKKGYRVKLLALTSDVELNLEGIEYYSLNSKRAIYSIFKLYSFIFKLKKPTVLSFSHQISIMLMPLYFLNVINLFTRNINVLSCDYAFKKGSFRTFEHWIIKLLYRSCGSVICQSNGMKNDLVNNYGFNEKKIEVINNPSDDIEFIPMDDSLKSKKYFLFSGRLVDQKNLFELLDIFKGYRNRDGKNELYLIGDGNLRDQLKSYVEVNNILGVVFKGSVSNPSIYYKHASATVLTSHYEGFPNVLIESLQYNTPVISYDCNSGPSEIIKHGVNGFLVDYRDRKHFIDCLVKYDKRLFDRHEILELLKPFDMDVIGKKYREFLDVQ